MVKIKWLKSAKEDLKDIYSYISSDSKRYASLQIEKILKRTEILKRHILIEKIVEELNNPLIRELIERNFRIIYRIINEKEIHILMIHHNARDLTRRIN